MRQGELSKRNKVTSKLEKWPIKIQPSHYFYFPKFKAVSLSVLCTITFIWLFFYPQKTTLFTKINNWLKHFYCFLEIWNVFWNAIWHWCFLLKQKKIEIYLKIQPVDFEELFCWFLWQKLVYLVCQKKNEIVTSIF